MEDVIKIARYQRAVREDDLHYEGDVSSDEESQEIIENATLTLGSIASSRYLSSSRQRYRRKAERNAYFNFEQCLHDNVWLNDREFQRFFRFSRFVFMYILEQIKNCTVFQTSGRKKQAPPAHQLMVFLCYCGQSGNGNNNEKIGFIYKMGAGTMSVYRDRVANAIVSLRDNYITWPNAREREQIAMKWKEEFPDIPPGLVSAVDGTYVFLAFAPSRKDMA